MRSCFPFLILLFLIVYIQKIQFAKEQSDIISKRKGTFVPKEKRKRGEEEDVNDDITEEGPAMKAQHI